MKKTKAAIRKKMQSILHKYKVGERLQGEDLVFMMDMIQGHPSKAWLHGDQIEIALSDFKKPAFFIVDTNKVLFNRTTFAYAKCVDGENEAHLQNRALRNAILPQKTAFVVYQTSIGRVPGTYDVHHEAPNTFAELVKAWRVNNHDVDLAIDWKNGDVVLLNEETKRSWQDFHGRYAHLVALSKDEHKDTHRKR